MIVCNRGARLLNLCFITVTKIAGVHYYYVWDYLPVYLVKTSKLDTIIMIWCEECYGIIIMIIVSMRC